MRKYISINPDLLNISSDKNYILNGYLYLGKKLTKENAMPVELVFNASQIQCIKALQQQKTANNKNMLSVESLKLYKRDAEKVFAFGKSSIIVSAVPQAKPHYSVKLSQKIANNVPIENQTWALELYGFSIESYTPVATIESDETISYKKLILKMYGQ